MLNIIMKSRPDAKDGGGEKVEWKIGDKVPSVLSAEVYAVEAGGDELIFVLRNFPNIVYRRDKPSTMWFGDMAVMIAKNL